MASINVTRLGCAITAWCRGGEPDQSERCAAADHDGPSMYTSGWRRMQQPQFAWQLPYPCGYGGRSVPVPSSHERHRPAASTIRVTPPRVPHRRQCGSLQFRHSCTRLALRTAANAYRRRPPRATSPASLNCFKLTTAPPSNNRMMMYMAAPLGQREKDAGLREARDDEGRATCASCGHRWLPRTPMPRQCPECHSPRWHRGAYSSGRRAQPKARKVWPMSID